MLDLCKFRDTQPVYLDLPLSVGQEDRRSVEFGVKMRLFKVVTTRARGILPPSERSGGFDTSQLDSRNMN